MGFIQQLQTKSNSFCQIEKGILYTISDQRSINMPTLNYNTKNKTKDKRIFEIILQSKSSSSLTFKKTGTTLGGSYTTSPCFSSFLVLENILLLKQLLL